MKRGFELLLAFVRDGSGSSSWGLRLVLLICFSFATLVKVVSGNVASMVVAELVVRTMPVLSRRLPPSTGPSIWHFWSVA